MGCYSEWRILDLELRTYIHRISYGYFTTRIRRLVNSLYGVLYVYFMITEVFKRIADHYSCMFNTVYLVVMCDNDFTTISIIMVFMSRYDNYHDSKSK